MTNWDPRAIDALAGAEDFRGILFRIAAKHPKAVVDACAPLQQQEPTWVEECRHMMRADLKINAIKHWRAHSGDGLKEAKDACEALKL
jgi:ribosomal protein L7/L12